jgi:hypothetical protein
MDAGHREVDQAMNGTGCEVGTVEIQCTRSSQK